MTQVQEWRGVFPALLTMFTIDGELNLDASAAHAVRLVDQGAHGVVVAGTSGEFVSMTRVERASLVRAIVDAVGERVPVMAGTGAFSSAETVALTNDAADAGAHAALVILPYYQKPAEHEVLAHFRYIAARTDLPVLAYNNPTNSGTNPLSAQQLGELEADGSIVGIKSTFPTVHEVAEAIAHTTPRFRAFYGGFMAPLEGLSAGACGWISGILNVALPDALALWHAVEVSDLTAARQAWQRIALIRRLYTCGDLGAICDLELYRSILRWSGAPGGHSRRPLLPLSQEQIEQLNGKLELIYEMGA